MLMRLLSPTETMECPLPALSQEPLTRPSLRLVPLRKRFSSVLIRVVQPPHALTLDEYGEIDADTVSGRHAAIAHHLLNAFRKTNVKVRILGHEMPSAPFDAILTLEEQENGEFLAELERISSGTRLWATRDTPKAVQEFAYGIVYDVMSNGSL